MLFGFGDVSMAPRTDDFWFCGHHDSSENQKSSVLLLEAGGKDNNLFIHMPSGYSQIVPKASKQNYEIIQKTFWS